MPSKTPKPNNRVVIAMSGGVDSSVAALLLKEQGYEVIGISLKVWDESSVMTRGKTCCSFSDIQDARHVCALLDIPFYSFDFKDEFKGQVIDRFVAEYYEGRTPNPCILCNQHIKFNRLLSEAHKLGAAYLATGHHARVQRDDNGIFHLRKGVDDEKDQSYVLFSLTQNELSQILFPVGELTKSQVREIAREHQLPTAGKQESQDICFIPDQDHARFIEEHFPNKVRQAGNFVDHQGCILGSHRGIHKYTIGQRRGLGIGFGERLYVTKIDPEKNEVVLGPPDGLLSEGLIAKNVNWVLPRNLVVPSDRPLSCGIKIRYQKSEIPGMVEVSEQNGEVNVRFHKKHPSVTPGQAAVFYRDDEVLGGGWIERSDNSKLKMKN